MRKLRAFGVLTFSSAALTACVAGSATFRPADTAGGRTGRPNATHFDIDVGGEAQGAVKVWSQGAYPDPDNPAELVVAIRLRIQNMSDAAMTLDLERSDVELVTEERKLELVQAPVSTTGALTIEPGGVARIGLRYPVPAGLAADDLGGFDFNFTINTGKGPFLETASFGRQRRDAHGVYFWPMWDPWWWGYPYPWGMGVGVGVDVGPRLHDRGGRRGPPRRHR